MNSDKLKRWLKISFISLFFAASPYLIAGTFIGTWLTACTCYWETMDKKFESIKIGDDKSVVLQKMGNPVHIQKKGEEFYRAPSDECENDCEETIWYASAICLDLELWFISFDNNGEVIEKYNLTSP